MKKIITFFFLLSTISAYTQIPDILAYSRVNKDWNVFLLEEFRVFMTNLDIKGIDPKNINLSDPIVYSQENLKQYVTNDLHNLLINTGEMIGFDYAGVKPSLIVSDFGFTIKSIKPTIEASEDNDGNVTLKSNVELSGLEVSARDITIEFDIPGLSKKTNIRFHNPTIVLKKGVKIDFDLDVKFVEDVNNQMKLELFNGNFSKITEKLSRDNTILDIIFDEEMIEFPEIKADWAGRDFSLNHQVIIDMILKNKTNLKALLFDQLHQLFKKNIADEILKKFSGTSFKTDRWIPATSDSIFPVYLNLVDLSVPFDQILMAEIGGDFCTTRNFVENQAECVNRRLTEEPISMRNSDDLALSKELIRESFRSRPELKLMMSVSEEFINKSIVTTYDFGIWDPMLKEMGVTLGDKNILVKFDETGSNATILMDIVYDLTKFEGLLLKQKFVRFPAILKATARIEYGMDEGKKTAQVVFNIHDVVLDHDILMHGHKEYGFPSNVDKMRWYVRKLVIKKIKGELFDYDAETAIERLGKWSGVDLPPVVLPEVNNMHLEKMHVESDGLGRLNVILEGDTPVFRRRSRRRQ